MNVKKLEAKEFAHRLEKYFRPQSPVVDAQLLQGREEQLRQVERTAAATGRAVFIWGDRGVGKTSLAVTAAQRSLGPGVAPLQMSCDARSSMLQLTRSVVDELMGRDPLSGPPEWSASVGAGVFKAERRSGKSRDPENVHEAARQLQAGVDRWEKTFPGRRPVVIVDEFDILPQAERKYFGDLIKQIGDRRIATTLIFCGVADSLEDLLGGHESAHRYIETVKLERLYLDASMAILAAGAEALGVKVHKEHKLRTAQISDGYPHFVHLIGSSVLWEYYDDPHASDGVTRDHFERGILRAVAGTEKGLEDIYHKATRKYTAGWDYCLWALADHHQLIQASNMVFESYKRIIRDADRLVAKGTALPEIVSSNEKTPDPLDRTRFNRKLNALKAARHGQVVTGTRAGWYKFATPMLRGYCRLLAQRYGIQLGMEQPLSSPQE